jgi:xylan 1,4-beta-xylosidase
LDSKRSQKAGIKAMKLTQIVVATLAAGMAAMAAAQTRTATLTLDYSKTLGPMEMNHIALGQGGLSPYPMWNDRIAEIRTLHPKLIRLFVQEYFDVLPAQGRYHFETLDPSVDEIVEAGATPLMLIAIKPKVLFPKIDQDIVDPTSYAEWEALIFHLVDHYKQRGQTGLYWEIGNEGDIGESGGSPYRFTFENYVRYYRHTVAAILKADPTARVGGPAVANWKSPILPALVDYCDKEKVPLNFISWHTYTNHPKAIQETIESMNALLAKYPALHVETILDEWNMALTVPPQNLSIQPAFVVETAWRMKQSNLTYSCFYHIRDYHVDRYRFASFFSPGGASFMANWWNRMPQYSGLFDYQNVMRPAYFAFELLSRVTGTRLAADSSDDDVHAFLSFDKEYEIYNLLFWNFSEKPVSVTLNAQGLPEPLKAKRRLLDAASPSGDENARLRPLDDITLSPQSPSTVITLQPYGVESWSLEPLDWEHRLLGR